jgi:hypothetical protein
MKNARETTREYFNLVIEADTPEGQIWLGDGEGHFVQKAVGVLNTDLLPGDYVVEFGLKTTTYSVALRAPLHLTEREIRSGKPCPRPQLRLADG